MKIKTRLQRRLAKAGWRLSRLDSEAQRYLLSSFDDSVPLPVGAQDALNTRNPAFIEIAQAYEQLSVAAVVHSQWNAAQLRENLSMAWFRGDNVYVWQYRQLRGEVRVRQYLALLDVESRDQLGLMQKLQEDGLFGCWTFQYGDRDPISRDLLDSVNEINYLNQHLDLASRDSFNVLDIGAGYGRLAYRMTTAFPQISEYHCIDAIAQSSFLCDYYIRFRQADERARMIRLDQSETLLSRYDLAVNIHSFSECTMQAIEWWLAQIAQREIPWLLIVPNEPEQLLSTEVDGSKQDFMPAVLAAGYQLTDKTPVYQNPELHELIGVRDHFFLFKKR